VQAFVVGTARYFRRSVVPSPVSGSTCVAGNQDNVQYQRDGLHPWTSSLTKKLFNLCDEFFRYIRRDLL
jgi:hypothetical protein